MPVASSARGSPDSAAILAELGRVVESPVFGGPARQVRLLRFLVTEALEGRGDALSASLLATRVFDRPADFDPAEDTIVRVEMSKLRRALARYYAASPAEVRIEIERGRYAPVFAAGGAPPGRPEPDAPISGAMSIPTSRDGPRVAVLPFAALNTASKASRPGEPPLESHALDTRGAAFARGLTDRLHSLFGSIPCVTVLSRAATIDEAAARGARYVIEGTVRLVAGALRVTVKAHDTKRWVQVWGDAYDRVVADGDVFATEDELARAITTPLLALPQGAIHAVEAEERASAPIRSAYEAALRFPRWVHTFDRRMLAEIQEACARIVPTDADAGVLHALDSVTHLFSSWTVGRSADARQRGAELARRAVRMEPRWAVTRQALAFAHLDAGDGRGALSEAEAALQAGGPLMLTGLVMALAGEWERGTAVIRAHITALKRFPGALHHAFVLDAYRRRDYAAALVEADAIATPVLAWDPFGRTVALARLGRLAQARGAARELVAILPEIAGDPRSVVVRITADEALRESLLEGLRLAGIG